MKKTNKNNNANNAQANAQAKTPSMYVGMYREIKAAAQTPSAVVKSFYNAALSINGGEYADIYKKLFGDTKNDFCSKWTPKIVAAFQAQKRCKHVTLFFVWRVIYKEELGEYLKVAKSVAKATKGGEKRTEALEALEGLGEAAKAAKK